MKKFFLVWLLTLAAGITMFSQTMSDGHQLSGLWKEYDSARKADRPQKEAEILSRIKEEALRRRLPVDYYDAATAYVQAGRRRDWKQGEKLEQALESEVAAYGDPMMSFHWMSEWKGASSDELWAFVKAHPGGFEGRTEAFYRGVDEYLGGALRHFIRRDREYVLWRVLGSRRYKDIREDEIFQALSAEVKGAYPAEPTLELVAAGREKEALQALSARYAGKAVSLYPRALLLELRKEELDKENAAGVQYKALFDDASLLEKERLSYKGDEALIAKGCTYPALLKEQLQESRLWVRASKGSAQVMLQNLKGASLTLRDGNKTLRSWKLSNPAGTFYVPDTLKVELPQLPDGDYTLEAVNGRLSAQSGYTQYTLSLATCLDSRGRCVYVTDYESGKPLEKVTLALLKSGKEVASTTLRLKGFTPLPAAFVSHIGGNAYYTLEARDGQRRSQALALQRAYKPAVAKDRLYCHLYKDRGAYNPGDTLHFKAVVFEGTPGGKLGAKKAFPVQMILRDSEGNQLESLRLTTNDWGSVSGTFALPRGLRNGYFHLEAEGLAGDSFRVDEYVLPSFELSFDPVEELFLSGADVPVSGRLKSYSGHNLRGARLEARVSRYGVVVLEQEVPLGEEDRFAFTFPATEPGYYHIEAKVVESGGETLAFTEGRYVGDDIRVSASLPDAADASLVLSGQSDEWYSRRSDPQFTLTRDTLRVSWQARDNGGNAVPLPVSYRLLDAAGAQLCAGEVPSASLLSLPLPSSGLYRLEAVVKASKADGTVVEARSASRVLCLLPSCGKLPEGAERLFVAGPLRVAASGAITGRIGSGEGDAYVVASLYGNARELLHTERFTVPAGSVKDLSFPYKETYPDAVRLQLFYFIHGKSVSYEREYRREKDRYTLPLSFTRFRDAAFPGARYTFSLTTAPGAEVLAAAWDKSLDAVAPNHWPLVTTRETSVEGVYVSAAPGRVSGEEPFHPVPMMRSKGALGAVMMSASAAVATEESAVEVMNDAVAANGDEGGDPQRIREKFSQALTFQPHLRPGADGKLDFSFETSDKLSTYYVRVYAHDTAMHNAVSEREMVVSLPVKVALLAPRFLYAGDVYDAAVTVSSISDKTVSGLLVLEAGESVQQLPVSIAPGETVARTFRVPAPAPGELVLTASFRAAEFSDAVRSTVPVYAAAQRLTESHSAVLRHGESREALLTELQGRFVNIPASEATLREITVLDMVRAAIPDHVEPRGKDVLSLSEAWYVGLLASRLLHQDVPEGDDLLGPILACRNADGGFGWFEGMHSSAMITAVLLERVAKLRDRGFGVPDLRSSVQYLDRMQFGEALPYWRGFLSDAQYMHVRALYADVPFDVKPVSTAAKKRLDAFKKGAGKYLTPSRKDGRGLEGRILEKARRLLTLRNLLEREGGVALAKAWGVGLGASARMERSLRADVTSLLEYAVEHRDGGWYYPNAVMPWRGLLESEAYAHALLCDLLSAYSAPVADGIRLWLMLQKETQHWDAEPAFIDAVTSVLDGSEAVLDTRVLALSGTYEAPFEAVKASGNGFTLERRFYREVVSERVWDDKTGPNDAVARLEEIAPGDSVSVGDKIVVKYLIWNAENRSFVRLTAGREASLQPVQQLSGHIGYGFVRPLGAGVSGFGFSPQGYRNVKASCTQYYFDAYPEEKTEISEAFFVQLAGTFVAPAVEIESLYAPHYRANTAYRKPLPSR